MAYGSAPYRGLKAGGGGGGGVRTLVVDPNEALWGQPPSSASAGPSRYWRPRGRLGLGQAEGKSLLGTTEGNGVRASAALPLANLGPCLRPRPRLPAAKPAAAEQIGACAASCARDSANAWGPGGGRGKLSHVRMLLGLCRRRHPSWAPG